MMMYVPHPLHRTPHTHTHTSLPYRTGSSLVPSLTPKSLSGVLALTKSQHKLGCFFSASCQPLELLAFATFNPNLEPTLNQP